MVMLRRWPVKEGREWSCYRGCHFNSEKGHVTEVVCLMEGEWSGSYYRFYIHGGRMVMLQRWSV